MPNIAIQLSKGTLFATSLTAAALISLTTATAQPLVDVSWLKQRLGQPGYALIDLRSAAGVTKKAFARAHIPGSVFTDYRRDGWRVKSKGGVKGVIAPLPKLETLIGRLGISNASHVVLIANGHASRDMATATRIYWTFKVLGHDKVSVLNGGFLAWIKNRNPKTNRPLNSLASGPSAPLPNTFKAAFSPDALATRTEIQTAIAIKTPLIDNRLHAYFIGLSKSNSAKTAGTLPGASVLPHSWLTTNGGKFRSRSELEKIYRLANVPVTGKQITFCNTGHLATLGWFVSSEILGNKNAKMYDGSMADWTSDTSRPVHKVVDIK